jgi:hypothetical protein
MVAEAADTQMMEKIIANVEEALGLLMEEINRGSLPGAKEQETILDGLELFISLAPGNR